VALRLDALIPGAYYEPEVISVDEIKLHRVLNTDKPAKLTLPQALNAIEASKLQFTGNWEELKKETRG
jgi:hypothetical protein